MRGGESVEEPVDGSRDGVAGSELRVGEQVVEHGDRDHMVCDHLLRFGVGEMRSDGFAHGGHEFVEGGPTGRLSDQRADLAFNAAAHFGGALPPGGPHLAIAAFLDDLGGDDVFEPANDLESEFALLAELSVGDDLWGPRGEEAG